MKIKRIRIENFRSIDALDLDLVGPGRKPLDLAVIAAPNSFGKTSVLEACIRALRHDTLLPTRRKPRSDIRKGCDDFEIILTLADEAGEEVEVGRNAYGPNSGQRYSPVLDPISVEYFTSWRTPEFVGTVELTAKKRGRRPTDNEKNRLWRLKQLLVNTTAEKAFVDEADRSTSVRKEHEAFAGVHRVWEMFYPDRHERFVAKKAADVVPDATGYDIYLQGRAPELIPLDDLSSGEIEILSVLGRYATGATAPHIVFVDEPELHLHPAWHRAMLRAFQTVLPDAQILCATHSTEILDSVYSYERFTILPADDPRIRLVQPAVQVCGKEP